MHAEYLLFNLVVLVAPLIGRLIVGRRMNLPLRKPLFLTLLIAGGVFIGWDIVVVGKWWDFSAVYTLGIRLVGLPLEEWLFFMSVGFGMLTLWVNITDEQHRFVVPLWRIAMLVLAVLGGEALILGMEYSGVVLVLMAISGILLHHWGFVYRKSFWIIVGGMLVLTAVFNSYLTARPIVTYSQEYKSTVNVGTIPVEDFGFGLLYLALLICIYDRLVSK